MDIRFGDPGMGMSVTRMRNGAAATIMTESSRRRATMPNQRSTPANGRLQSLGMIKAISKAPNRKEVSSTKRLIRTLVARRNGSHRPFEYPETSPAYNVAMRSRVVAHLLRILIVLASVWVGALLFYPEVTYRASTVLSLWAASRSECGFQDTLAAIERSRRFAEAFKLAEGSTKIRQDGDYRLWRTPLGEFWIAGDMSPLNWLVVSEQLSDIYGRPDTFGVRRGEIVIDCGADYGMYTRKALQQGASKVLAIEISPAKQECLRRTFAREIESGRVIVATKGVWDKNDTLHLRGDTVVFNRPGTNEPVQVTPMDELLAAHRIGRVDLIKIDIEGAEPQALKGARETLRRFRPRVIIATENAPNEKEALGRILNEVAPVYTSRSVSCEVDSEMWKVISKTTLYEPRRR